VVYHYHIIYSFDSYLLVRIIYGIFWNNIFRLFAIIVGILILIQFVDGTVEEIIFAGGSILFEPYDRKLSTNEIDYFTGIPILNLPEPAI